MSTTVKTGWLKDKEGNKFAPKTLTSQVQTSDGVLLEDKIQTDLDAVKAEILENVSIPVDDALSSTSENPVQNKVVYETFDTLVSDFGTALSGKADASHSHAISDVTDLKTNLDIIAEAITEKQSKTLIVTATMNADGTTGTTDYSSSEIMEHINAGGETKLIAHDGIIPFYATEDGVVMYGLTAVDFDGASVYLVLFAVNGNDVSFLNAEYDPSLQGYVKSDHTHDDRYYTETEIDTKLDEIDGAIDTKADKMLIVTMTKSDDGSCTANYTFEQIDAHMQNGGTSMLTYDNDGYLPVTMYVPSTGIVYSHATFTDGQNPQEIMAAVTPEGAAFFESTYEPSNAGYIKSSDVATTYETKTDASSKLDEAKTYADTAASTAATTVKNDLLNGAGEAYDTLKELGDLITENVNAIDALESIATGKADKIHTHTISEVTDLKTNLDAINDTLTQKSQVQVVEDGSSEVLPTLKIHKLTQEEYDQEVANGTVDANAIYLTPEEEIDLSNYATIEQLESKADSEHSHDDLYYTESEVDSLLSSKADSTHNHDSVYDTKGSADSALASAKEYTDTKVTGFASASHSHDDRYYTESEINTKIDEINTSISTSVTEAKSYADTGDTTTLKASKTYTDEAVATKTQVQMIIWEDDD